MLPETTESDYITADLLSSAGGTLIDVRTPESYAEAHIQGAANHCVYEVGFMEEFPEAHPDRAAALVVYGEGDPYEADRAALGRLQYLGYENVLILKGGLQQWRAESREVEGEGPTRSGNFEGASLTLDTERTKVRWIGRNLINQHHGEVAAVEGYLEISPAHLPVQGKVTVDLRRMSCHDLNEESGAGMLIDHLASADFFDVANHPRAEFEILSAEPIADASYGKPNFRINGQMTARGKSAELAIEALMEPIDSGYVFQTTFSFDRTILGALYGSGKFFERLGMHLVNDLVSMDITAFFNTNS